MTTPRIRTLFTLTGVMAMLLGLAACSDNPAAPDVAALGTVSSSLSSSYLPVTWTQLPTGIDAGYSAIWGTSATDLYVEAIRVTGTTSSGLLLHTTDGGATWTQELSTPAPFNEIWGTGPSDVYAVGGGDGNAFWHFDGSSWTAVSASVCSSPYFPSATGVSYVWGVSPTEVYTAGVCDHALDFARWNGTSLTRIQTDSMYSGGVDVGPIAQTPSDIFGSSGSDIWIAGSLHPVHWDGTAAHEQPGTGTFRTIWGSGTPDDYFAGSSYTIWHYDGSAWTVQVDGLPNFIDDIWGTGPDNVYAVGVDNLLHYDGTDWSTVAIEGGPPHGSTSVWIAPTGEIYVAAHLRLTVGGASQLVIYRGIPGAAPPPPTNSPPTATITAPSDGARFLEGEAITFSGSGTDPEDGSLSGSSLVWTSDLDGRLGTGTGFDRSDLSVGTHEITLTATDADGAPGSVSVSITVQRLTPTTLADVVADMLASGAITDPDVAQGLTDKLAAAQAALDRGSTAAAGNILRAFIDQVEAQRGSAITDEAADELIGFAERLLQEI